MVKNSPANAGDLRDLRVQSLGQEDPLEEGLATHSSILAWEIPGSWTEKSACNVGHLGSISGLGRFGGGDGKMAKAADGKATKIIIPSEIQGLAGLAKSVAEVGKEN